MRLTHTCLSSNSPQKLTWWVWMVEDKLPKAIQLLSVRTMRRLLERTVIEDGSFNVCPWSLSRLCWQISLVILVFDGSEHQVSGQIVWQLVRLLSCGVSHILVIGFSAVEYSATVPSSAPLSA
jgi:hypothetical protein